MDLIFNLFDSGRASDCLAADGPAKGLPCIFPFKYNGVIYNTCSNKNKHITMDESWCSTKVDESGNHIGGRGNWGNCDENCPLPTMYGKVTQDIITSSLIVFKS